ncbi:FAD-dependent oxidoreductase [Rhodoferax sp.]|uniref:FAD-dependent oxidoreductase n=1 Tax=Rhodoferax sp. TaxID=50421 RepID=UPI0025D9BCEC|nr:FAD-dependent oxidoreductase [Rhodoferax sp.]
MNHPLLIIGAGLAGWQAVREFRKLDTTTPVTLVTADAGDFYAKPTLSNAFGQKRGPAQLVTTPAATIAQTLNVTLLSYTQVTAIDTAAQVVQTSTGPLAYRDLVLATGAQPIRVPLAGAAADQVLSVNSLADFGVFHQRLTALGEGARVAIMGAGLIGCEFANDLAGAGYAVAVVDPSDRPLAALLPPTASVQLQAALEGLSVQWHLGTTVQSVEPQAGALSLTLGNGQSIAADIVLSAIGLRADTALAQAAGIACERGIVVNRQLQTSAPHVWGLGDGAQYASAASPGAPTGRTLPYVMPIMAAAKVLAANLCGTEATLEFAAMPVAIKTPALPIVAHPPAPGHLGAWVEQTLGEWWFAPADAPERAHGFVLTGTHTSKRMALVKQMVAVV